jgi:hypothetical protein
MGIFKIKWMHYVVSISYFKPFGKLDISNRRLMMTPSLKRGSSDLASLDWEAR